MCYKRMIIMKNHEMGMNICKDIRGEINNKKKVGGSIVVVQETVSANIGVIQGRRLKTRDSGD